MANQIPISYVISASAVAPSQGIEPLKLSTILILTHEEPANTITGDYMIARNSTSVASQWGTQTETAMQAMAIFSQQPNILANDGYVIVAPFAGEDETYSEAIARLSDQLYFEGILTTKAMQDSEIEAASTLVESMNDRILFVAASSTSSLTAETGLLAKLSVNTKTKCLLYTQGTPQDARLFAAAYASKGLSVNYNGSNTTITMNLKDLAGVQADTNITETILAQCESLGVDCYPSIEGLPKVLSFAQSGQYFDQVANQIWLVSTIQRAMFNVLATTRTKIAQTDADLEKLTKAIRGVCNQAVTNGYCAPGVWNSPDTFGVYDDFFRNIEEFGYYIYHQPVAEQAQSERQLRKAPLFQIALKEAGAVHSGSVLIYIEA